MSFGSYLKSISVSIIILFITLSVVFLSTIDVASATLSVKNTIGGSGITGFRAASDTTGVNITSSSQAYMDGTPCIKQAGTMYACVYSDELEAPTASYMLSNDDGDSEIATIRIDNSIGDITYTVQNTQNHVILNYNIIDTGFNGDNSCSGIKKFNVYSASSIINTVNINGAPGTCTYSGSINLSITGSGKKTITLEVLDNVGNKKSTEPQEVVIDLSAPTIINGLKVKYTGTDEDMSIIGGTEYSATFYADLYFNIREQELSSITIDLSDTTDNPVLQQMYKSIPVPVDDCTINDSASSGRVYECHVSNVLMKLPDSTLSVTINATDMFGNTGSAMVSKTFTIDSVEPTVSITTGTCDSSRCYIHDGENYIMLKLNKQNFDRKQVFFNLQGSDVGVNRVQNCTGNVCTALVLVTCIDGTENSVEITSFAGFESADDSGNVLIPYSTTFYCDNTVPKLVSLNVTGDASSKLATLQENNIVSGSTVSIKANVTDTGSSSLKAVAWLDTLTNTTQAGTCVKSESSSTTGTLFDCRWSVNNIAQGPYTANIVLNISDVANNTLSVPYTFKVFGFKSDNDTPNSLGISKTELGPHTINRAVLGMATQNDIPYYIYSTYNLFVLNDPGKEVEVLYQSIDINKCLYISREGNAPANMIFSEAKLSNPYGTLDETNRVDLRFRDGLASSVNAVSDTFVLSCNISAMVREGDYIYTKPQNLMLDISFKFTNSALCTEGTDINDCNPGAVLGRKIKDAEDNFFVKLKFMSTIDALIPKLQSICKMRDYITMSTVAADAAHLVLNMVDVIRLDPGGTLGNTVLPVTVKLHAIDSCLSSPPKEEGATDSKCAGIVGKACDFLNCKVAEKMREKTGEIADNSIPDLFGGEKFYSDIGPEAVSAIKKNSDVPDVSNSIIMSAYTGCFPAMYYNLNKYRQIECSYLYCLKTASYSGLDISVCDKAKYSQTCSAVVGEVFELPGIRTVKNYMNNAADLVKNALPLAALSGIKRVYCHEYISFETGAPIPQPTAEASSKIYLCEIPLQVARLIDSSTRSKKSEVFNYPSVPDMCLYAQCIGEQNCVPDTGLLGVLEKMPIPTPNNLTKEYEQNKQRAQDAANVKDLRTVASGIKSGDTNTLKYSMAKKRLIKEEVLSENDFKEYHSSDTESYTGDYSSPTGKTADYVYTDADYKYIESQIDYLNLKANQEAIGATTGTLETASTSGSATLTTDKTSKDAKLNAAQKKQQAADAQIKRIEDLQQYNKLLSENNKNSLTPKEIEDYTKQKAALEKEIKDNMDNKDTNLADEKEVSKLKRDTYAKSVASKNNLNAEEFGNTLYIGLQYANAKGIFGKLVRWYDQSIIGKTSSLIDADEWKDSLCNPDYSVDFAGLSDSGSVISCTTGNCLPVLSYAAERTELSNPNGTAYNIYTMVYYVSGGDLEGQSSSDNLTYDLTFKIILKTDGGIERSKDFTLASNSVVQDKDIFTSKLIYTTMCVQFNKPFPRSDNFFDRKEYCRSITSQVFDMGSPYVPDTSKFATDESIDE